MSWHDADSTERVAGVTGSFARHVLRRIAETLHHLARAETSPIWPATDSGWTPAPTSACCAAVEDSPPAYHAQTESQLKDETSPAEDPASR